MAAGFAAAEVIVDATYRTQVQTHSALEAHGVVADWKADGLTVYASTQGTSTVRDELAEVLSLQKSQVRVITEFMGGGFGAKFGIGNFGVLATHLSKKAGAPVRLMLDRKEEQMAVGNRPSSVQRLRIGAKKDGTLTAIHLEAYGTAGAGTGAGCGGPAKNMYPCPNVLAEESDVFIHAGPAAAFRAPGHPQGCFALEQTIDELAEKLGMDPLALRDKIDVDEDLGGKNVDSLARNAERRLGAARSGWPERHAPGADRGPVKRGIGVAQAIRYRFVDLDASCEVRITRDGSVEIHSAVQDLGTGIRTALAMVVAEELGLRPADVTVRIGDTRYPQGPASGGSKTTGSITPAARNAAWAARVKLLEQIAPTLDAKPERPGDGRRQGLRARRREALARLQGRRGAPAHRGGRRPRRARQRRLRGLHRGQGAEPRRHRRLRGRAVQRRGGRHRDGHRQGGARGRRPRLRPAHQPAGHREPDQRRRPPGPLLRALRGSRPRSPHRE